MPNHCQNALWIRGSRAEVEKLQALTGLDQTELVFDFEKIMPPPQDILDEEAAQNAEYRKKYPDLKMEVMSDRGYYWRRENWCTKWNAYNVVCLNNKDLPHYRESSFMELRIEFQTAWSPPEGVIVALAKLFPELTYHLEYFEFGGAFCGGFTIENREDFTESNEDEEGKCPPFVPGTISRVWEAKYYGHRGG